MPVRLKEFLDGRIKAQAAMTAMLGMGTLVVDDLERAYAEA